MFLVFNPTGTQTADMVPPHGARGPGHVAFALEPEAATGWRERLERHGVAIELQKKWPNGSRSLYFRDPAGNSVELVEAALWGLD
jgi:catechol 2,3-dioxygenase-like lactoylglutathione lyase family enzyme